MPLQKILLTICFLAACTIPYCQYTDNKDDSTFFESIPFKDLKLDDISDKKNVLPFSDVTIIDARFDTFEVGFIKPSTFDKCSRLSFSNSAEENIKNYIFRNYGCQPLSDSVWNLVILLDKFWITNVIVKDLARAGSFQEGLIIKANILAERGGQYHPLYKIDSIYTRSSLSANNNNTMLEHGIDRILEEIVNKKQTELKVSKRILTLDNIRGYINDKFAIPILNTEHYKPGIYRTFEEFKNNMPSIINYEVLNKKGVDVLHVNDEGSPSNIIDSVWGFSDGVNVYTCSSGNFFLLFKQGKTFETNGFKSLTYVKTLNILVFIDPSFIWAFPFSVGERYKAKRIPLQVDMETGELF